MKIIRNYFVVGALLMLCLPLGNVEAQQGGDVAVIMKMTDAQFQDYWVKKVYSGTVAHEPLALMSTGMQLEAVRSQKGGIALMNAADVKDGVRVVKVDGLLPGAAGYPLK